MQEEVMSQNLHPEKLSTPTPAAIYDPTRPHWGIGETQNQGPLEASSDKSTHGYSSLNYCEAEESHSKLRMNELTRTKQRLIDSEKANKAMEKKIQGLDNLLIQTRETVKDLRDERVANATTIAELTTALAHERELVGIYQQLVATQNHTLGARPHITRPATPLKHSLPLEESPPSKRRNATVALAAPTGPSSGIVKSTPTATTVLRGSPYAQLTEKPESGTEYRIKSVPQHQEDGAGSHNERTEERHTSRGSDHYNPSYAGPSRPKMHRNVEMDRPSKQPTDRQKPPASKRDTGGAPNVGQNHPLASSKTASQLAPREFAENPAMGSRTGTAEKALARARRQGIPYDPANHVGIPRQCEHCPKVLPSGNQLAKHMRAAHKDAFKAMYN